MARGSTHRHVAKDGTVSWYIRRWILDPETGTMKHPQRVGGRTKREAESALRDWEDEIASGASGDRSTMTVAELLDYWLETYIVDRKAITTVDSYSNLVRLHLKPSLGRLRVQQLTAMDVQRFYLAKEKASTDVIVRRCHIHLCSALDVAVSPLGIVPANVARAARLPARAREHQEPKREKIALTQEQSHAFLESARGSMWGPLYQLLLTTGIRRGEALGLRWSDVDLVAGRLSVVQTLAPRGGPGFTIKDPKNPSSARVVKIPSSTLDALKAWRLVQNERRLQSGEQWQANYNLIWCDDDGSPIDPDRPWHDFRKVRAAAVGVPDKLTIHELRHSFITLSLDAGVPMQVVSRMAGHSKISTTYDIYVHIHQHIIDAAIDIMESVFYGHRDVPPEDDKEAL